MGGCGCMSWSVPRERVTPWRRRTSAQCAGAAVYRGRSAPSGPGCPGWGSAVAVLAVACRVRWSCGSACTKVLIPEPASRVAACVLQRDGERDGWMDAGPHRAAAGPPAPVSHSVNRASGAQVAVAEGSGFRGLRTNSRPLVTGGSPRREGGGPVPRASRVWRLCRLSL